MVQFFNSINEVRKNYSKYDDWEQKQADERAKKEYLAKNIQIPADKLELTKKRAETVIRATEMMDARSEDNCQNMEMLTNNIAVIPVIGLSVFQVPLTDFVAEKATSKIDKKIKKLQEELNGQKLKKKTTYKDIQKWVEENYGFKVHTAYIAEVKRDLCLPMYDAPNAVEELKRPRSHPTEQMTTAIKAALKHFEII